MATGAPADVVAYLGNKAGGVIGKNIKGIAPGILKRTGVDATRTTKSQAFKGLIGNTSVNPLKQKGLVRGLLQQQIVAANRPKE